MFQDSDLKQYLDQCGSLMSMHNVKVRASGRLARPQAPLSVPTCSQAQHGNPLSPPGAQLLELLRPSKV